MARIIRTRRLSLVFPHGDMLGNYLDFIVKNKSYWEPWEGGREAGFHTRGGQIAHLKDLKAEADAGQRVSFWMFARRGPGFERSPVVGTLDFFSIVRGPFSSCLAGYRMDADHAGQGYMTEALKAGAEHMFRVEGMLKIQANIMPENLASVRVAEKAGFSRRGLSRRYLRVGGAWRDHLHMVTTPG